MNVRLKFALWLAVLFAGIVAVVAAIAVMLAAGLPDADHKVLLRIIEGRAPMLGFVALLLLFACAGVLGWLFKNYVTAVRSLTEQTRIVFAANPEHRVLADGGSELVDLAATINRLADAYRRLQIDLETRAGISNARLEEERNRLARDLHDSAKQKAFAALAQLGTANGILKSKPNEVKPHLIEAETLVYEVIQELTFLIQEIYPIALQEKGLPTTLREYIFEWENRNDTEVNVTVRNERSLPLETEQAIYRIIQEALANVARHQGEARGCFPGL